MATWIKDDNGNKCSVEYFGSEDAARAALASLKDCRDCTNCSGCSGCSGCSDCSNVAYLYDKTNIQADPDKQDRPVGPPTIPVIPNIHQAVYAAASNPRALEMGDVHARAETHCRGGWVVTLAGKEGAALEEFFNWELAAMLIYSASDPGFKIHPARFYDGNTDALADMKRLAEAEAAGAEPPPEAA